jgi:hypothetical protein
MRAVKAGNWELLGRGGMTRDETGRGRWMRGSCNTLVQSEEAVVPRESEEEEMTGGGMTNGGREGRADVTPDGPIGHQQYWGLKRGWSSMEEAWLGGERGNWNVRGLNGANSGGRLAERPGTEPDSGSDCFTGGESKDSDGMTSGPMCGTLSLLSRIPPMVLEEDNGELSLKQVLPLGLGLSPPLDDDEDDDDIKDSWVDVQVRWWWGWGNLEFSDEMVVDVETEASLSKQINRVIARFGLTRQACRWVPSESRSELEIPVSSDNMGFLLNISFI